MRLLPDGVSGQHRQEVMSIVSPANSPNKGILGGRFKLKAPGLFCLALLAFGLPASSQIVNLFPQNDRDTWTRVSIPPGRPVNPVTQWHIDSSRHRIVCDGNRGHEWMRFNREL